ncbi:MAG: CPBP family intramembrane metalloprotease [Clostridia bacterium]|nr:CPBP family intramembrane metalloprotease [Clostridia bacterium]
MQEQSRPAMQENRLSKSACAVLLLFMAVALFVYKLFFFYSEITLPIWTDILMETALILIPSLMLCLLCGGSVPHVRMGFKRTALVIGMGVTGYVFSLLLNVIWTLVWMAIFSGTVTEELSAQAMEQYAVFVQTPLWLMLLVIAVTPAICEEFFFRGMLMKSLSGSPAAAICISGILFAMMHMSVTKFYATFALGIFFGWIVMRTGSMTGGVILHFMNNAFAALTLRGMGTLYGMLEHVAPTEEAIYDFLMARPELSAQITMAVFGAVLLFVLSIPLFFLFLTLFIRDTKADAAKMHLAALRETEENQKRDVAGNVLLSITTVVLAGLMIYSSVIFGG